MYSSSLLSSYAQDLADQIAFYRMAIIIAIILALLAHVWVACEVSDRTKEKGYSGGKYALLTFFMPVVGTLLMISLPDKKAAPQPIQVSVATQVPSTPPSDELPDL